jgi:hypothetical protein
MKKIHYKIAAVVACVLLYVSCTKTGPAGANGSSAALSGNIEGLVFLYDDADSKILTPASLLAGDTITLTNNSNGQKVITTTSTTGSYTFTNVSAGTYSIVANKHGYGSVITYGFQFVGGGTAYQNFNIAQIPTVNLVSVTTSTTSNYVIVNGTVPITTSGAYIGAVTFVSLPGNNFVNATSGNYVLTYLAGANGAVSNNTFSCNFTTASLYNYGFASGSTIYFATYTVGSLSKYLDPNTGLLVYTALGSPIFTSAIVP